MQVGTGVVAPGGAAGHRQFGIQIEFGLKLRRAGALGIRLPEVGQRVAQGVAGRGTQAAVRAAVQQAIQLAQAIQVEGGAPARPALVD